MEGDLTAQELRSRLTTAVNGSQKTWAKEAGVSAAYVSDVIAGRREPGRAILDALGYEKVIVYRAKG